MLKLKPQQPVGCEDLSKASNDADRFFCAPVGGDSFASQTDPLASPAGPLRGKRTERADAFGILGRLFQIREFT